MAAVSLSICFKLGQALRYGDAGGFFEVYDSFLAEENGRNDKLDLVKELARQISELGQEDFILLHTALHTSSSHQAMAVQLAEPVEAQLASCLERLRPELTSCTSDSGAVSDFDGSVSCDDATSTSNTALDDLSKTDKKTDDLNKMDKQADGLSKADTQTDGLNKMDKQEESARAGLNKEEDDIKTDKLPVGVQDKQPVDVNTLESAKTEESARAGLPEEDAAILVVCRSKEDTPSIHLTSSPPQPQYLSNHHYHRVLNVRRKPTSRRDYDFHNTYQIADKPRRSGLGCHGYSKNRKATNQRRDDSSEHWTHSAKRKSKKQQTLSQAHEQMAQFLWKGWQQVQKELKITPG